jgi:preprotein translocase subunit SecD
MVLAGVLADLIGLVLILSISAGLYILSGVLAWIILPLNRQTPSVQPAKLEKEPVI